MRLLLVVALLFAPLVVAQPVTEVPPPPPLPEPLPPKTPSSETIQSGVTIRREDTRRIEEYRVNGELIMVRVIPDVGPTYILMDSVLGQPLATTPLDDEGPVKPVRYILHEW